LSIKRKTISVAVSEVNGSLTLSPPYNKYFTGVQFFVVVTLHRGIPPSIEKAVTNGSGSYKGIG